LFREQQPLEAILGLCKLRWRRREGRVEREDTVAERNLVLEIAFVQGLYPHQRRGPVRAPAVLPRAGADTRERDALTRRNLRDRSRDLAAPVPDLGLLRKAVDRNQVRVRPLDARYEDEPIVR